MNILVIVPARKDSKRCPGKNTRKLNGIELYRYTLDLVYTLEIRDLINTYCVTTDIKEILKYVNKDIIDVIKRPNNFCQESSTEFEFIEHTLNWYKKKGITFDDVAIFYPTIPFRKVNTIEKIFKQWSKDRQWASQLRTVKEIRWEPEKIWYDYKDKNTILDLQSLGWNKEIKYYKQIPYCYIYKINQLYKEGHYSYQPVSKFVINDPIESHDINTEWDFKIAEFIVREGLNE